MSADPSDDGELLDAYSRTLTQVAAALAPSVAAVQVTVHKPAAPVKAFVADISATVERRRHD